MNIPNEIEYMLNKGAHLVVSISGGKDSDAMLKALVKAKNQKQWSGDFIAFHADLGRMEWKETPEYIESMCKSLGVQLVVERHAKHDLLDGIRARRIKMDEEGKQDQPHFPSSAARYCTSGWKRSVCDKWVRNQYPESETVIIAIGLRAEESASRSKKPRVESRVGASAKTKNRDVYNWYPILDWSEEDVWESIGYSIKELKTLQRTYSENPKELEQNFKAHVAYLRGNHRLSCAFCVLANQNDLINGAKYNRELFRELVADELDTGFQFQQGRWLADLDPSVLTDKQLKQYQSLNPQLSLF